MSTWFRTLLAILAHRSFASVIRTAPDYVGSCVSYTDPANAHASTIGIIIGVRTQSAVQLAIDHVLGQIGPITMFGFTIPFTAVVKETPMFQSVRSGHYATLTGSSIAGTLGAVIPGTESLKLLSCSHVIALSGTATAGTKVQTMGDGVMVDIGTLIGVTDAAWAPYPTPNRIDAALAVVEPGITAIPREVEHMQFTTVNATYRKYRRCWWSTWNAFVDPIHEAALLGASVFKIGHTTLRTDGYISGVDASISVIDGAAGTFLFERQLQITGGTSTTSTVFSDYGDSGAMVITTGNNRPRGIVMAGSGATSYASAITEIMDHYGIRKI